MCRRGNVSGSNVKFHLNLSLKVWLKLHTFFRWRGVVWGVVWHWNVRGNISTSHPKQCTWLQCKFSPRKSKSFLQKCFSVYRGVVGEYQHQPPQAMSLAPPLRLWTVSPSHGEKCPWVDNAIVFSIHYPRCDGSKHILHNDCYQMSERTHVPRNPFYFIYKTPILKFLYFSCMLGCHP